MKYLLVLLFVAVAASMTESHYEFFKWMKDYNMNFKASEIAQRYECFQITLQNIDRNRRMNPLATFDVNEFSHLCPDEFRAMYLGYKPTEKVFTNPQYESTPEERAAVPTNWDWSQKGATTPIKNQGQCGSCWAFSTTEGVESGYYMTKKSLHVLAPQQIVDCDQKDSGCGGGWLSPAFNYIKQNGQESEASYPYQARNGQCKYNKAKVVVRISSATEVGKGSESEMKTASYAHGPLSVCVDATTWNSYSGGIMTSCGDSLDHCVQVVGWGTSGSTPYWKVRNSWGASWGESGYIRIEYGHNLCGISTDPWYAEG